MKVIKSLVVVFLVCVAFAPADKPLKVEGSLGDWNKHLVKMDQVKRTLANKVSIGESKLTEKEFQFLYSTVDSLQQFVIPQLQKQLSDTTNKK